MNLPFFSMWLFMCMKLYVPVGVYHNLCVLCAGLIVISACLLGFVSVSCVLVLFCFSSVLISVCFCVWFNVLVCQYDGFLGIYLCF